jgi:tetratricopeptide (TPR) repeat protein
MQSGYEFLDARQTTAAARVWLEAWSDALFLFRKARIESIEELDARFRGTQSLFNWIQDLESELWNAGLEDRQFLRARIDVCGQLLEHFALGEDLITENLRGALADSHYELGETGRAEALYRDWLTADPQWGWGWIGWSDCHWFTRTESKDFKRAEEILREGLAVTEVRDRPDIAERLADLCEEQGRRGEAIEIRKQIRKTAQAERQKPGVYGSGSVLRRKTTITFGDGGLPLDQLSTVGDLLRTGASQKPVAAQKVGRNELCPCGSGKKFKKCCGRSL